jgi:hypothetical protein
MFWYDYKVISVLALFTLCLHNVHNEAKPEVSNFTIQVDDTRPGPAIPDDFLGFSYEPSSLTDTVNFRTSRTKYLNLLNNLGRSTIRINGYYANWEGWVDHPRTPALVQTSKSYKTDTIASSDLDSLFAFIRKTNYKIILGINTYTSTPAIALSEISYAWSKGKDIIQAFELSNEPDGLYNSDYALYRKHILPFYDLIRHSLPSVPLVGCASVHPEHFGQYFVQQDADKVLYTTIHAYPVGQTGVKNNIGQLLDEKYIKIGHSFYCHTMDTCTQRQHIRYRIDECNNFGDEGIDVADRFASALWGVDFMMDAAANNALGVNFHGGSRGFTPILMARGMPIQAHPLYYAMLFFHMAGRGNLLPINVTPNDPSVKAYATLTPEHTVLVTLINKNIESDVRVNLSCTRAYANATLIRLAAPSVNSKDSIQLAGTSVDSEGKWKPAAQESITLANGKAAITLPRGSVTLATLKN